MGNNFVARKSPLAGIDAPTPAREKGLQPYGALTLFFRWRKKSVQKKASGTATPEAARPASRRGLRPAVALRAVLVLGSLRSPAGKKARPFWRRGSLCRAQWSWLAYAYYRARSELAFFRRQNGRAFFPPLPIAALLPRSWRGAGLPLAGWESFLQIDGLAAPSNEGFCSSAVGGEQSSPLQVRMDCCIEPHQTREPRGLSPSGGLNRPPNRELCQTREPWHLSCHRR